MLKKNRPLTIPSTLKIKSQGETIRFNLVYRNLKQSEWSKFLEDEAAAARKMLEGSVEEMAASKLSIADTILHIVESWESEYELSREGIEEMHDDRPGLVNAIVEGFNLARQAERVKN